MCAHVTMYGELLLCAHSNERIQKTILRLREHTAYCKYACINVF